MPVRQWKVKDVRFDLLWVATTERFYSTTRAGPILRCHKKGAPHHPSDEVPLRSFKALS